MKFVIKIWLVIILCQNSAFGQNMLSLPEGVGEQLGKNFSEFLSTTDHEKQSALAQIIVTDVIKHKDHLDFILWSLNNTIKNLEKNGKLHPDYKSHLDLIASEVNKTEKRQHFQEAFEYAGWMFGISLVAALIGGSGKTLQPIKKKRSWRGTKVHKLKRIGVVKPSPSRRPLQTMIRRVIKPATGQTLLNRALKRSGFTRSERKHLKATIENYTITGKFDDYAFISTSIPGFRVASVVFGPGERAVPSGYYVFEVMVPGRITKGSANYFITKPIPQSDFEKITAQFFANQPYQPHMTLLVPRIPLQQKSLDFLQQEGSHAYRYSYNFRKGAIYFGATAAAFTTGFYISNGNEFEHDRIEAVDENGVTYLEYEQYNEDNVFKQIGIEDPFEYFHED